MPMTEFMKFVKYENEGVFDIKQMYSAEKAFKKMQNHLPATFCLHGYASKCSWQVGYYRWKMKGDDKNHEIRFKQIERTLKYALDNDQRQIIELKYFGSEKVKDSYVYNELIMRRDSFYENKKIAIRLIATALGII
ncbi:hypothetical protein [Bacillus mycoides]|uniref:hypothetical protein n=1 Tax=Bacillus mycoides TaxID=1405 RepID=UPI001F16D395|nr:hypothetical protein [Bacillus mycoides]